MALLAPATHRIAPGAGVAAEDRAPDALALGTPEPLRGELIALLGADRVLTRAIDLIAYASDASPYRRLPQAVVMAHDADDVVGVLAHARRTGIGVTLRAAGTSLNGQAQGDGILVDVRRHWRGVQVEDAGARVRVGPGTALGYVNRVLARHGRRLGPDPASTHTATVGGVIANNSGGMRCGVVADSYKTVTALTFVLASGAVIDSAAADAAHTFAAAAPELAQGLIEIRDEIRGDPELAERIRRKFAIKNTMGYRLCAFLDADEPVEIFRRLLVGSEGTLAFIAEAVLDTVARPRAEAVSWLHFSDIDAAVAPVADLVAAGASAVELMVAPALISAAYSMPGTPEHWKELDPGSAALLVELGGPDQESLDSLVTRAQEILSRHELARAPAFTRETAEIELAWTVREGLFGLVGKLRPAGSSLIIEDVCVAPQRIAEAAKDMQALLGHHGFLTGVAGHASAGNLHFMLTPALGDAADRGRYDAFMGELVDLIVDRYDGSLKAEHGTGVNMAPFLEREWGSRATELMWRVKALADPHAVLGPGVLLNRDPSINLRHLQSTPAIEEEASACVECGFCEPVCPSRHLTTTPRQRIVIRREMIRQAQGSPVQRALVADYEYDALQTCATDGTCRLACPVDIDTGALVRRLRAQEHTKRAERAALGAARHWAAVEQGTRAGLGAGGAVRRRVGDAPLRAVSEAVRSAVSAELVPSWPSSMPEPAPARLPTTVHEGAAAVYLPACINRIFGAPRGEPGVLGLPGALVAVSERARRPVWIPDDVAGHCCGTPWSSKGYREGHAYMTDKLAGALRRWSDGGRLPVVVDASSCTLGLIEGALPLLGEDAPAVIDSVTWAHEELLPRLRVSHPLGRVVVHPPCSSRHLGTDVSLAAIARAIAGEVHVPITATCCGFAGDRGLLHPELPSAALADAAAELAGERFDAALCSNRTCEIGLQQATGEPYASFFYALEQATR